MKKFNIYINPQGTYEAVKQGWSWPGFCFTFIWAFTKKLWVPGGVLLCIAFLMGLIAAASQSQNMQQTIDMLSNVLGLIASIIFGMNGNKWRETNLSVRGYALKGSVEARNGEAAINEFIQQEKLGINSITTEM